MFKLLTAALLKVLGICKKPKVHEPEFKLEDQQRDRYRRIRQWVANGVPVLVRDPLGGVHNGLVIFAVTHESYWNDSSGAGLVAFALDLQTRETVHINADQKQLEFIGLDTHDGKNTEYQHFLAEAKTLPVDRFNHYTVPLNIPNPAEGSTGKVAAQIILPEHRVGCESTRLPRYLVLRDGAGERSQVYFYGIDNVPLTALELRSCIETTENVLIRQLEDLEVQHQRQVEVVQGRLNALRTDTKYQLTVTERYDALLTKYPKLKARPRLRSVERVRHIDIDEFGVPYTRDLLPKWFAKDNQ